MKAVKQRLNTVLKVPGLDDKEDKQADEVGYDEEEYEEYYDDNPRPSDKAGLKAWRIANKKITKARQKENRENKKIKKKDKKRQIKQAKLSGVR